MYRINTVKNMKRYYIGKYSDNCCDEMNLEGVKLFTLEEKADFEANWKSAKKSYYVSAGQWGDIEYKNGKEVLKHIDFYEISESTYNELLKTEIFEYWEHFPDFEDYLDRLGDEEEND